MGSFSMSIIANCTRLVNAGSGGEPPAGIDLKLYPRELRNDALRIHEKSVA